MECEGKQNSSDLLFYFFVQALPVDEPISRLVGSNRDLSKIWHIPEFQFRHALCLVPTLDELVALNEVDVEAGARADSWSLIGGEIAG